MSDNTSSTSAQSSTVTEQAHRGRQNRGGRSGGRPYHRRRQGERLSESPAQNQTTLANKFDKAMEIIDGSSFSETGCIICTEPINYYAVADCNHRTCHLCCLRTRALYKNKNCAYCKKEQIKVIFTRDPEKLFQDYEDKNIPFKDEKLNIFCEDQEMLDDVLNLLKFKCPDKNCKEAYDGWQDVKRHVRREHRMWLCDLCIRHKKSFAHEHTLFTRNQLDKHFIKGDEPGFNGHPSCEFCRIDFYGDDELYEHCRNDHEQCHICSRAGIRHQYYIDYGALERHFRSEHFLCPHQECLDKKFVVFESDIDLKAHEVETHEYSFSGQRAKKHEARRIDVNFSYGESRLRSHRRNQERQVPENTSGDNDGGRSTTEDNAQQTQNLNTSESSTPTNYSTSTNVRAVRPPPGFGVLSNEIIGPPDDPPPQNVQRNRTPSPIASRVSRVRDEEFPTLSSAVSRATSNNGISTTNYSEKVRANRTVIKLINNKPKSKPTILQQSTRNGESSKRNEAQTPTIQPIQPIQGSSSNTSKGKELASISGNQATSISNNTPNYSQKLKNNADTVISRKSAPLSSWNNRRSMMNTEFPALEPVSSPPQKTVINNQKSPNSNKPTHRVLVIKSSNTRSGSTRP